MAGQGAPLGAERLFQQDVLHSVGSHCLVENDGCTEMTTDPRDAEIARYDFDLMESRMVKDQWGGEWVRHSDHAAEIARLTAELRVYMDAAEAHAVETMRQYDRAEKAEAERDAALAREAALLASNQTNRDLLYQLTGAQSEVTHLRNRFDTAVATARAEGRKEGLREAAALCDDTAQEALEESGAESRTIWTWFRGQRDAILAAAEKEAVNG